MPNLNVLINRRGPGQYLLSGDINAVAYARGDGTYQLAGDITGTLYVRGDGTATLVGVSTNATYSGVVNLTLVHHAGNFNVFGSIGTSAINAVIYPQSGTFVINTSVNPTGFNPASIAGYYLDYDPDRLAGNDGNLIGTLTDFASGVNATAAGSLRATLKKNILNGHAVARFAGAQGYATADIANMNRAFTIFAVVSASAGSDQIICELSVNSNSNPTSFLLYRTSGNSVELAVRNTDGSPNYSVFDTTGFVTTTPTVISAVCDPSLISGEATVWLNGVSAGTRPQDGNNGPGVCVTAPLFIGGRSQSGLFLNGDLARLLVYQGALSAADRQYIETNLRGLFGL